MMHSFKLIIYPISISIALWVSSPVLASGSPTLEDFESALQNQDEQEIQILQSYILGAVDTHLHYARQIRNWTQVNALCTGISKLNGRELGAALELKITTLKRRYGQDIMGMPIAEVVPMIVEEQYRCF